ncbi:protein of unknown function DUF418 [Indibacter alkaliphilus LW1]|uniref:DUF418 domain-containing protein n=1 Tax=Indibacter alkaliphilus (strain CCUG 57479 / KCTC 22604 / LW1) TaxID=1189612 RepID=S2DDK6_INDAL|nr:DUF418 domain-containing protein [Indibacter alkaliphilus]EOZ96989.1 protein of unknown function DUF418 [Indibacter alkaliphilus LW1]
MALSSTTEVEQIEQAPKPAVFTERIEIIDIIRGVALLGILILNIPYFSMEEYFSEPWSQDTSNPNFWVHAVNVILFEGKMRALFSMVFGAGIVLFTTNKEKSGRSATWLFYKRMIWLTLFGLAHAHLILWIGDILYFYGLIGMLAFLFRKMKPKYLAMGVPIVAVIGFVASTLFMQNIRGEYLAYKEVKALQDSGVELGDDQLAALDAWEETRKEMIPNKEEVVENTLLMKGSYADVASHIRPKAWDGQTKYLIFSVWDMLALMLLGIALYKWGFLTMKWTQAQYIKTIWIGYGIGLPLVIFSFVYNTIHFHNVESALAFFEKHSINWVALIYDFQRILIMMAHVALVIVLYQKGLFSWLMKGWRAVGQLAFTNYVMHSVICTLVFFGYGLSQYAEWEYFQLYYLVVGIWIFQLLISPIWLKYFLFGPLEWLWRCLTYGRIQPFVRR